MKSAFAALLLAIGFLAASSNDTPGNALNKVLDMIGFLETKLKNENAREAKLNGDKVTYCAVSRQQASNALRRAKLEAGQAEAIVNEAKADIDEYNERISELAESLAKGAEELKEIIKEREKEEKAFKVAQLELTDSIETMDKAITLIAKEVKRHPASLAQLNTTTLGMLLETFDTITDAAGLGGKDKEHLVALLQSVQGGSEDQLGAPAGVTFKSSSGGILEILENMKEKAEGDLSDLQKTELTQKHNYKMLKIQREADIKADTKEREDLRQQVTEKEQVEAEAQGDLDKENAQIDAQTSKLKELKEECLDWKLGYEKFQKEQVSELDIMAKTRKAITAAITNIDLQISLDVPDSTESSDSDSESVSLLQVSSKAEGTSMKVVEMVRALGRKQHSEALMQLASRIKTVIRYGSDGGSAPLDKVETLVVQMLDKLKRELANDKAMAFVCKRDQEAAEASKAELTIQIRDLGLSVEKFTEKYMSDSDNLQEKQTAIADNNAKYAMMQDILENQTLQFQETSKELRESLKAIEDGIGILRDYYNIRTLGERPLVIPTIKPWVREVEETEKQPEDFLQTHAKTSEHFKLDEQKNAVAANGIIELLTLLRDDLGKQLTMANDEYTAAKRDFDMTGNLIKVENDKSDVDVKFYSKQAKEAKLKVDEKDFDLQNKKRLYKAEEEALIRLEEKCVQKPIAYAERKAKREAEIKGLKEALVIIRDETAETALVQQSKRRQLRGFRSHAVN